MRAGISSNPISKRKSAIAFCSFCNLFQKLNRHGSKIYSDFASLREKVQAKESVPRIISNRLGKYLSWLEKGIKASSSIFQAGWK